MTRNPERDVSLGLNTGREKKSSVNAGITHANINHCCCLRNLFAGREKVSPLIHCWLLWKKCFTTIKILHVTTIQPIYFTFPYKVNFTQLGHLQR